MSVYHSTAGHFRCSPGQSTAIYLEQNPLPVCPDAWTGTGHFTMINNQSRILQILCQLKISAELHSSLILLKGCHL